MLLLIFALRIVSHGLVMLREFDMAACVSLLAFPCLMYFCIGSSVRKPWFTSALFKDT